MTNEPRTYSEYIGSVELVRSGCLHVATTLGDYINDTVIVGGLVPYLLINQDALPPGLEPHAGTTDLDLGIELGLLEEQRYQTLSERLRAADFAPDVNDKENKTFQRWRFESPRGKFTIDFLIPPTDRHPKGGHQHHLEEDFAAIVTEGLQLALEDRREVTLSGRTLDGATATRSIWVCGPGPFVVLKAFALHNRKKNKDAYDLIYMLRSNIDEAVAWFKAHSAVPEASLALRIIARDFTDYEGLGATRVADFLSNNSADEVRADVIGWARQFLDRCMA